MNEFTGIGALCVAVSSIYILGCGGAPNTIVASNGSPADISLSVSGNVYLATLNALSADAIIDEFQTCVIFSPDGTFETTASPDIPFPSRLSGTWQEIAPNDPRGGYWIAQASDPLGIDYTIRGLDILSERYVSVTETSIGISYLGRGERVRNSASCRRQLRDA